MDEELNKQQLIPAMLPPAIRVRRGLIGEITIHQITEDELKTLEHGHPDSAYFNYSIFLLSTATSFLTALLTTPVKGKTFNVFIIIIVLGYMLGSLLLILWYRGRKSIFNLVKGIRDRLPPPEGIQELVVNKSED